MLHRAADSVADSASSTGAVDDLPLVRVVREEGAVPRSTAISSRTNGWSSAMISRIRASMRSRSSSVNVAAAAAARSRSRSRPRSAGRWRTWRPAQIEHRLGQTWAVEWRSVVEARIGVTIGDDGDLVAVGQCRGEVPRTPPTSTITAALASRARSTLPDRPRWRPPGGGERIRQAT